MAQIYEKNALYEFLLPFVNFVFRHSFRSFEVVGREHLPSDGAIIYAPNHSNALLDALAILALDNERKVFVARADIFRRPRAAAVLRWLKMMPIRRMRDGVEEVLHNDETQLQAIDSLRHRVPFCIMPEGTHRPSHELMPLKKGICRIALQAEAEGAAPVYIVPVNLYYSSFIDLWCDLRVQIGQPFAVGDVARRTDLTYPEQVNTLLASLTDAMTAVRDQNAQVMDHWYTPLYGAPSVSQGKYSAMSALFFILSVLLTLPVQIARPIIRRKVQDPCFRNSVQYLVQLIYCFLTLGLGLIPLRVIERWRHS